ncbi:hypothetical protein, conserved in T. vivax [Trypanosoma vivax Y486]|uniref:Uncharacterized protein n=1 Tax=Trypanosoma vivax (strain Y486) TaxID=1055687 RepID=F9WQI7_TRYVY|nr:hypothetical protein, conserved in T. vivax [Trypanosoma vivax Y486]|eukprot:CCD19815.1 hypothetical protein, conserved in T. vivax [Trypanosoma vivax Y486]
MSLESEDMGNVAALPTGFEHNATKEELQVMREALGTAAGMLGHVDKGSTVTPGDPQVRKMAERILQLHGAEQQKALAAQLSENVKQRTALTAAAIDMWIKTFAANYHSENEACIIKKDGSGGGAKQTTRFAETDDKAKGCAVTPRQMKKKVMRGKEDQTSEAKWREAVEDAKKAGNIVLVGTAATTKCTLTASTANSYAGADEGSEQQWGFFWQLTGAGTADGVTLKWSDAHQDAGTDEQNSTEALNEMWLNFRKLREVHQNIIGLCKGQATGHSEESEGAQGLCGADMRRARLEQAQRILEAGKATQGREGGTEAQIQHQKQQATANATQDEAQGGTQTQQNKQGGHRETAARESTAASESAAQDSSCRQQARGAAASLVAFLAGARNRKHAHE